MKTFKSMYSRIILLITIGLLASSLHGQGIYLRKKSEKYGYIKSDGKPLTEFKYDYAEEFRGGVAIVKIGKYLGLINEKGDEILPPKYTMIENFSCGLAQVCIMESTGTSSYGYINKKGVEVIPLKYSTASQYKNNVADVYKSGEGYALIDTLGKVIVPHGKYTFFNGKSFKNRIFVVTAKSNSQSKQGLINAKGVELIPPLYDRIDRFEEGLALVQKNKKYGYIDSTGREVIPCEYIDASNFKSGFACVKKDSLFGFIDSKNKPLTPFKYSRAKSFTNSEVAIVKWNSKTAIIDKRGIEIPLIKKYDQVSDFEEGYSMVKFKGKWGFIDRLGDEIAYTVYDSVFPFREARAVVKKGNLYGFINTEGEEVTELKYDGAESFSEGLAVVKQKGQYGYINQLGKEAISLKYIRAKSFSNSRAIVTVSDSTFYIDKSGKCLPDVIESYLLLDPFYQRKPAAKSTANTVQKDVPKDANQKVDLFVLKREEKPLTSNNSNTVIGDNKNTTNSSLIQLSESFNHSYVYTRTFGVNDQYTSEQPQLLEHGNSVEFKVSKEKILFYKKLNNFSFYETILAETYTIQKSNYDEYSGMEGKAYWCSDGSILFFTTVSGQQVVRIIKNNKVTEYMGQ